MNALLEKTIESRQGHYCHAVEVSDVCELENIAEAIVKENEAEFDSEIIIDFLETLQVYCLDETNETDVYNFSFRDYISTSLM